ncbi:ATP-binding protein [Halobacteria archaeon AArc-dxtr1]|nr:ATP-binding protein [Halobacteria archaeon AArc-dxtr1]
MSNPIAVPSSPKAIAALYVLVSTIWIATSDQAVDLLVDDPSLVTQIQTAKGFAFVAGSGLLIYVLVERGQRTLEETNDRLDRALKQTTILLRLLRHNLRNSCNVIGGNVALLQRRLDEGTERLETIEEHTEELVLMGEKTSVLRQVLLEESAERSEIDLANLTEHVADRLREEYPDATIRTETPEAARIQTDPRLETALYELGENAIVHDDDCAWIEFDVTDHTDRITIELTDTGPGLPSIERVVLEREFETPMIHSEGLGLWIARTVVHRADGELEVRGDSDR